MKKNIKHKLLKAVSGAILLLLIILLSKALLSFMGIEKEKEKKEPALVKITLHGELALDLKNASEHEEEVKAALLTNSERTQKTFHELIKKQIKTVYLQTVFREPSMPIPDETLTLETNTQPLFNEKEKRITLPYVLSGYIATQEDSLLESIPDLKEIGSAYAETLIVPRDPQNLFSRLGYACANQDEIPLGLVEDKNYPYYFDPFCAPGVQECKHPKGEPLEPCLNVLERENGVGTLIANFERVPYDELIANSLINKKLPRSQSADLTVNKEKLSEYDIVYKYFEPNSCAIQEQCVATSGMRRLLRFRAVTPNIGNEDIIFGNAEELASTTNQFEYHACHNHYHFNGYGLFTLEKNNTPVLPGAKQSFCVESTGRFDNSTTTPFTSPYQKCENQGLSTGWEDEYFIGLDCQWIDITDVEMKNEKEEFELAMEVNPQRLLCEGTPHSNKFIDAKDKDGNPILGPNGKPTKKLICDDNEKSYENNKEKVKVQIPKIGASVNEPCDTIEFGPNKNCDWKIQSAHSCTPNTQVTVNYPANESIIRACPSEFPCQYEDAITSEAKSNIQFICPTSGKYLLMTSPFLSN